MQTYEVIAEFQMDGGGEPGMMEEEEQKVLLSGGGGESLSSTPPLFDQTRLRKPEYWQCIKLIAPSSEENRAWKASDAVGAWCIPCQKRVCWSLGKTQGIHRHMETFHGDLLENSRSGALDSGKRRRGGSFHTPYYNHSPSGGRHHHPPPPPKNARSTPPLFNQVRLRKPEYWQCIKLIAPTSENRPWKAADALGSWCTICKEEVTWTLGNIQGVKRHMMAHHKALLDTKKSSCSTSGDEEKWGSSPPSEDSNKGPLFKDNQKTAEAVLIKWIADSLQPFQIVQEPSFKAFVQFLCNFKKDFTLPKPERVKKQIRKLSSVVSDKMMETISKDVKYYCLSMDTLMLNKTNVLFELVLRYLTTDFELKSFTLEAQLTNGSYTGESIEAWVEGALQKWGLPKATIAALMSDNDPNIIAACGDMDIKHIGCIERGLKAIVGIFLCETSLQGEDSCDEESEEENEPPLHEESFSYLDSKMDIRGIFHDELITEIRKLVGEMRKIARYIKRTLIAQEKIKEFARASPGSENISSFNFDSRPYWNSTYDMLSKLLKIKSPIDSFLRFLQTPAGFEEFNWNNLPTMTVEKWALLEGIIILLGCFYQMMALLNNEKHPTVVYALSLLRRVKGILKESNIFFKISMGPLQKRVEEFKETYGEEKFYPLIIQKMESLRETLLGLFEAHFSVMDVAIMWISVLDPRLRKMKHLNEQEKHEARRILIKEVAELKMENNNGPSVSQAEEPVDPLDESDLFNPSDIFDSTTTTVWKNAEDGGRPSSRDFSAAEREVDNYLHDDMVVSFKKDPLEWWKQHRFQFPQIAVLALKWLSALAVSTPSERLLSDIKRHKFKSPASIDQFMIMKNGSYLSLTIDDIVKGLE